MIDDEECPDCGAQAGEGLKFYKGTVKRRCENCGWVEDGYVYCPDCGHSFREDGGGVVKPCKHANELMPMPDTETVELRTDTIEQLADQLTSPATEVVMPQDRRRAVADRLRKQISKPDAVAFCGLPGAGKSHTAEKTGDVYDAPVVSMGDAIREAYKEEYGEEHGTGNELGDFAATWRADNPEGIPEKVVEIADKYHRGVGQYAAEESNLIIIDGVRSCTDYEVLNDYFDDFYLIEVQAEFYDRLSRIQKRGREGEALFDAIDLVERDDRERKDLGFDELKDSVYIDMSIKNGTGADQLAISLSSVVENNLPFEIANGKPLGLNTELEQQRQKIKAGGGPVGE